MDYTLLAIFVLIPVLDALSNFKPGSPFPLAKKETSYRDDRTMICEDTDNLCSFLPDAAVCNQNEALIDEVKRRCPKTCATCPVLTENGHVCKFPFKHEAGEKALYKCTNEGTSVTGMLHEGNDLWCAISVNEDMTYDAWDWCIFNW